MSSPSPSPGAAPKAPATSYNPTTNYGSTSGSTTSSSGTSISQYAAGSGLPSGQWDYLDLGSMSSDVVNIGVDERSDGPKGQETYGNRIQTQTVAQVMDSFLKQSTTNPNAWANVQTELYLSGNYPGKPTFGSFNIANDGEALKSALKSYLAVQQSVPGESFAEWLSRQAQYGMAAGGPNGTGGGSSGGSTRAPLQLTASGTLDQVGNTEAQSELGRNLSGTEQAGFVSKFHGEEQAAYNGGPENPGDPTAEAKQFIDTKSQPEVQNHMQAGYAEKMLSMFGLTQ